MQFFVWFFWETLFSLFQQMFVADDIGNKLRYRQLYYKHLQIYDRTGFNVKCAFRKTEMEK